MATYEETRGLINAQIVDGPPSSITPSKLRQLLIDMIDLLEAKENKDVANGYAGLGPDGRLDVGVIPDSITSGQNFKGIWDANLNSPTIISSTGVNGDYYSVGVAGSTSIDGISTWAVGDQIIFNGDVWQRIPAYDAVSSVAGKAGAVVLDKEDVGLGALWTRGADIASTSTVNLTTATGDYVRILGTTAITAITLADGEERVTRFSDALTLTNGASLILPTGANILTAAGDIAVWRGEASGVVRCVDYIRANGKPLANLTASAAQIRAATDTANALTIGDVASAMAEVTLTDAATVAWDMATGYDFVVTLGGNRTLGNPTNVTVGKKGRIRVVQDANGSRTLSFSSNFKFAGGVAPTLTTTANAQDYLYYDVRASNVIVISTLKDVK